MENLNLIRMQAGENYSKSSTPLLGRNSHPVTVGRHEWLIEDFCRRDESVGISLQTRFSVPAIDIRGAKTDTVWRLKIYPKGCDHEHADYVSIFINQVSGPAVWVKYAISLLGCHAYDKTPYVHNTRRGAVQFLADRRSSSRGWKKFISHEAIGAPGSSLLHDGGLLIRCVVELECRENMDNSSVPEHSQKQCLASIVNTTSFLDDMKYSDLTLECDNRTFPCHKFMLAKKSDVFDAMFSHNFAETHSNKVLICDLEAESVQEMIRYIYTGRVANMERVNKTLLAAADKYNISDLKEACEKSLCNSMTVENVCSLLIFARDRLSQELKSKAIDFIARNVEAVTSSEGWQELVRDPLLMTEVVRAMGPK